MDYNITINKIKQEVETGATDRQISEKIGLPRNTIQAIRVGILNIKKPKGGAQTGIDHFNDWADIRAHSVKSEGIYKPNDRIMVFLTSQLKQLMSINDQFIYQWKYYSVEPGTIIIQVRKKQ